VKGETGTVNRATLLSSNGFPRTAGFVGINEVQMLLEDLTRWTAVAMSEAFGAGRLGRRTTGRNGCAMCTSKSEFSRLEVA
jgi:hypothetical protein